jgi:outer membrane receptor for ferrienterochelin and colicins
MFDNLTGAQSAGIEGEIEARWPGGLVTRASHAIARTRAGDSSDRLTNSPMHLAKASAIVPIAGTGVYLGLESAYTGVRRSLRESDLDAFFIQNLTLTTDRMIPGADIQFGIHNLFNQDYSDPGAEEHVQAGIPQDGRTVRLRVGIRF